MEIFNYLSWKHVVVTIVVYYVSLAFKRLFFHPLAKFPGPKLAAVTRWFEAYYDVICDGQYTFKIAEMHKTYGPIIRISPFELHVNDPAFFEKLYRQDGRWNKYDFTYNAFGANFASICTIDHDLHKRRRAPMNTFFSKANVANRQDIIQNLIIKLSDRINEYSGSKTSSINLGAAISALTRDVATEFVLGKSYHNLEAKDFNNDMTHLFQNGGFMWRVTKHIPFFGPVLKSMPISFLDERTKSFLIFLQQIMELTKDTISSASNPTTDSKASPSIVREIVQSNLPPAEKTVERIFDDVGTVTGAAYETTAHTLRVIMYYVYSDPTILQNLRSELASARRSSGIPDTGDLNLTTLESLPYLTAVLMEGLRLSPAVASRMARIAPDRELIYDKWHIPAGTPVGMTTILMHMDERLYPDPERFEPRRWPDLEARKKAEKTFAPFSRGTRICLGMYLGWAELYMVTAALVQRFDFKFDGTTRKDVDCASDQFIIGTARQDGVRAFVTPCVGQ